MNGPCFVQGLVNNRSRIQSFVKFHRSLKDFGMKAMCFIDAKIPGEPKRQFVAAAIVSYREIEMEDLKCISDAEEALERLQITNRKVNINSYYLLFGRVIVILNLPSPKIHGEARLFDNDWNIREQISDSAYPPGPVSKLLNGTKLFDKMKYHFYCTFHQGEQYVICVFSFFIPCTVPGHMCAQLLGEFATRENEQLIVSYCEVHNLTNPKLAWQFLRNNNNVYCLHPKDVCFVKKDFLLGIDIELTIEQWLGDNEDFPECNKMVRRFTKRSSKSKFYRTERKKQKKFFRDNSYRFHFN